MIPVGIKKPGLATKFFFRARYFVFFRKYTMAWEMGEAVRGIMPRFLLERARLFCDLSGLMANKGQIDIDYVARLARIELDDAEKARFSAQLDQILGYFQKLSEVDVEGVEPSSHAYAVYNVWRGDEATPAMSVEDALMNAPAKRDNQIIVPKVVDDA